MITIKLITRDGGFVAEKQIPPFIALPEIMVWGIRHFALKDMGNGATPIYQEVCAFAIIDFPEKWTNRELNEKEIREAMGQEEESEADIATKAAHDRILGVAIQHYLEGNKGHQTINPECEMCAAVKALEAMLKPGELKIVGELCAWNGRNDG